MDLENKKEENDDKEVQTEKQQDIKETENKDSSNTQIGKGLAITSLVILVISFRIPYVRMLGVILSIISVILAPKSKIVKTGCLIYAILGIFCIGVVIFMIFACSSRMQ